MFNNDFITKDLLTESTHIYVDDATGDEYIFNGSKLVKIKDGNSNKPSIGDRSDEESQSIEDAEREKQAEEERAEDGDSAESEEEKQARLDKIKQFLDDTGVGDQIINDSEKKVSAEKAKKKAAAEKEIQRNLKGAARNASVIKQLSKDLGQFLAKEVGKSQRNTTWKKYNGNYDNSGIVRPGHRIEKIGRIPVIQIYIDQSSSFGDAEVQMAFDILSSIKEFEAKKQIKTEVYYFANHVHTDSQSARNEGGTGAGPELIQQLNATRPDNVIVITDSDFDYWHDGNLGGSYEAPGGVWLVFREGRSNALIRALHGKLVTKYYDIDSFN